MVKLLVAYGADVRQSNPERFTALHSCHYADEAAFLLDRGADIDAQSFSIKYTPLMIAARDGLYEVVRLLLRSGADPFMVDRSGRDAEAYAALHSYHPQTDQMKELIRDVKRAGSWKRYAKEPRIELVRLRSLCARGRATPPADPVLVRLFGAPASPTTKPARVANRRPLPNEVVWHVLAYWRSSRDA